MNSLCRFIDNHRAQSVALTDLNAAAVNSMYVSPRICRKIAFLIMPSGSAWSAGGGATSAVTLTQATSSGGAGAKALTYTSYADCAGNITAQNGAENFTVVGSDASPQTLTIPTTGANHLYVIEVDVSKMDIANGFDWVRVNFAATGVANTFVSAVIMGFDPRYGGTTDSTMVMKSAD